MCPGPTVHWTTTTTTILWPSFRDHPGEPVPEENFWTLWCKRRLTEADTLTIRLVATPSALTSAHLHHPPYFLQARCPSCHPSNSVKAPKATTLHWTVIKLEQLADTVDSCVVASVAVMSWMREWWTLLTEMELIWPEWQSSFAWKERVYSVELRPSTSRWNGLSDDFLTSGLSCTIDMSDEQQKVESYTETRASV